MVSHFSPVLILGYSLPRQEGDANPPRAGSAGAKVGDLPRPAPAQVTTQLEAPAPPPTPSFRFFGLSPSFCTDSKCHARLTPGLRSFPPTHRAVPGRPPARAHLPRAGVAPHPRAELVVPGFVVVATRAVDEAQRHDALALQEALLRPPLQLRQGGVSFQAGRGAGGSREKRQK